MPERPVILTGFMGSGKNSVGVVLAGFLSCRFIDLDEVIVTEAGKAINEIFSRDGEAAFRALESAGLERVLRSGPTVIATGGGVVISDSNRRFMREQGYVVNLIASLPVVLERLRGSIDRPLYSDESDSERVRTMMEQREQFYADADIRIDTDGKSVEDVAAEILRVLKGLHL